VVRQEPAKLRTGVRFPHAPPIFQLDELVLCPKMGVVGISDLLFSGPSYEPILDQN